MEQSEVRILQRWVEVRDFAERCVDIPKFYQCCRQCPRFGRRYSCPPFDFSAEEVWRRYRRLLLCGGEGRCA